MKFNTITLCLVLASTGAYSQTLTSTEENQSISSVILNSGGGSNDSTVRTHPDVAVGGSIPSPQTCRYGVGGGFGSLLFGGIGGSTGALDEGCEARADSGHFANLAVTLEKLRPGHHMTDTLIGKAIERMFQTRSDYMETWEEPWRP